MRFRPGTSSTSTSLTLPKNSPPNTSRLPAKHHVARHVGRSKLEVCPDTHAVLGVLRSAFELREARNERDLSVNHLEHYAGDATTQLTALKDDRLANGFDIRKGTVFAVVNVGAIVEAGKSSDASIAVYKASSLKNPSHAVIRGLPSDNSNVRLLEALAREATKWVVLTETL